jgi:hypothetical protein
MDIYERCAACIEAEAKLRKIIHEAVLEDRASLQESFRNADYDKQLAYVEVFAPKVYLAVMEAMQGDGVDWKGMLKKVLEQEPRYNGCGTITYVFMGNTDVCLQYDIDDKSYRVYTETKHGFVNTSTVQNNLDFEAAITAALALCGGS